jgi:hypothetical protein
MTADRDCARIITDFLSQLLSSHISRLLSLLYDSRETPSCVAAPCFHNSRSNRLFLSELFYLFLILVIH